VKQPDRHNSLQGARRLDSDHKRALVSAAADAALARGGPLSIAGIARQAGVGRKFIYDHPELKADIELKALQATRRQWFASDLARQDPPGFRPQMGGLAGSIGRTTDHVPTASSEGVLTADQNYDLWQRMLTGQLTTVDAAAEAGVDRSTIMTLRKSARDGPIAALQSRPGRPKTSRAELTELPRLRAEVERLSWGCRQRCASGPPMTATG